MLQEVLHTHCSHLLTVRCSYNWIYVSKEEESSNEGIEGVWLSVRELLMDKGQSSFAEPSNSKWNLVHRLFQEFEDLEDKVLESWNMLFNQLLNFGV